MWAIHESCPHYVVDIFRASEIDYVTTNSKYEIQIIKKKKKLNLYENDQMVAINLLELFMDTF